MYKASKLEQYSIKDNFLKKIAFIPSFPCENFFSEKKSFARKLTLNKNFFYAFRLAICSVFHGTVPYFDPLFRAFSALFRIFRGDQELSNGGSSFFLRHLGAEIIEVEYFDHLTIEIYEN